MKIYSLFLLGFFTLFASSAFAVNTVKPGAYEAEHSRGALEIKHSTTSDKLSFTLDALGANGHVCNVDGEIINNQAETEDKCIIQFTPHADHIAIELNEECRNYCGARAFFPDNYYTVDPYCAKMQVTRARFNASYKEKKYPQAKLILNELQSKCKRFMYWHTSVEILNDLAITEFHLGNKAACLKTLETLKEEYIDQDPYFTPIDEDWATEMAKSIRFNWKKCGGLLPAHKKSKD